MNFSLVCLALVWLSLDLAESRVPFRGVLHEIKTGSGHVSPSPFIFLTHGRSQSIVQGYEVAENGKDEEDEDNHANLSQINLESSEENEVTDAEEEDELEDEDDNPDYEADIEKRLDDKDDGEEAEISSEEQKTSSEGYLKSKVQLLRNSQSPQMLISRKNAAAILVPDEIVEIEGHSVIDQETGTSALLLPRAILNSIPEGSVLALLDQPSEPRSEERANRVVVRRRRKGVRRNIRRRRVNANRNRIRGGNGRRKVNNKNVRVVRINGNRRRNVRQGGNRRRVIYQG